MNHLACPVCQSNDNTYLDTYMGAWRVCELDRVRWFVGPDIYPPAIPSERQKNLNALSEYRLVERQV